MKSKLVNPLKILFKDLSIAENLIGENINQLSLDDYDIPKINNLSTNEVVNKLISQLEEYILQMANEVEEYDCEIETERLKNEAKGILLSIREIKLHFNIQTSI